MQGRREVGIAIRLHRSATLANVNDIRPLIPRVGVYCVISLRCPSSKWRCEQAETPQLTSTFSHSDSIIRPTELQCTLKAIFIHSIVPRSSRNQTSPNNWDSCRSHPQSSCIRTLAGSTIEMIVRFAVLILNARASAGERRRAVVTNIVTSFKGQLWVDLWN